MLRQIRQSFVKQGVTEEFLDKYVEIDTNDKNDYNKDNHELLNFLTHKYNNWLSKENNITKKIKT